MSKTVPDRILDLVALNAVDFDKHALEQMEKDNLSTDDVLNAVLTGEVDKVTKDPKMKDKEGNAVLVYAIIGEAMDGRSTYTVGKVVENANGEYYYCITAKKDRRDGDSKKREDRRR